MKSVFNKIITLSCVSVLSLTVLYGCGAAEQPTAAAGEEEKMVEENVSTVSCDAVEGLPVDFMMGVDVSSFMSEIESGVIYYDFEDKALDESGFFGLLSQGGVNLVRLRLWNDPYDAEGHTYGGGHCDLDTVTHIGKLATDAGMKVMIDFHYSDFWADPSKQNAPKAWKDMTVEQKAEAIYEYTGESLRSLIDAGVDVAVVQVGNETTTGLCGVTKWEDICSLISEGSRAVREVSEEKQKDISVAVHLTDPQTEGRYDSAAELLQRYSVDYDIFASSYYPYWHGDLDNLTQVLCKLAEKYDKKVMVTETSYIYTLADGDGTINTENSGKAMDTFDYDISAQGQIDALRALTEALTKVGDAAIGICYWEPAWIPVREYDENASDAAAVLESNQKLWETKGSGWATSYAGEYDESAKKWYGGSAVDNEAWFDHNGKPLPTVNAYKYIREGVRLRDGADRMVSEAKPEENYAEESFSLPEGAVNLLVNPGFEEDEGWEIDNVRGNACSIEADENNVHTGKRCLKFWDDEDCEFFARQQLTLDAGTYCLGGFFEGGDCGDGPSLEIYLKTSDGVVFMAETSDMGWRNWDRPEIRDIVIPEDGSTVTVNIYVQAFAGGWGAWDDVYLYKVE